MRDSVFDGATQLTALDPDAMHVRRFTRYTRNVQHVHHTDSRGRHLTGRRRRARATGALVEHETKRDLGHTGVALAARFQLALSITLVVYCCCAQASCAHVSQSI